MAKEEVKKTEEIVEEQSTVEQEVKETKKSTAKAGKRSEKGLKESEEKQAKIEAQHNREDEEKDNVNKPKQASKPTRSKLERKGKNYRKVSELVDVTKIYSINEAIDLALKTNPAKFDATVEVHIRLGVDPRQADQNIRDNLVLPAGTGKTVRVAVFGDEDVVKEAKKAGADVAGSDEFLQQLEKGIIDFDVLIATPNVMAKISKYARLLGPKGLMPNPKSGTVSTNAAQAVKEAKGGKVEYRVDKQAIVHLGVGKVGFGDAKLTDNAKAFFASLHSVKPSTIKGSYIVSVHLSTTMGPSVKVDSNSL